MNRILKLLVILTTLIVIFSCKKNDKKYISKEDAIEIPETIVDGNSVNKIKQLFEKINLHESENSGEKLYEFADSKTKLYYKNLINISINSDSTFIRNQTIYDKMMILLTRGKYSSNELKVLKGKDLFIDHYNKLAVVPSIVRDRILLNIKVRNDSATAELNSKIMRYSQIRIIKFIKENKEWKYNFTSFYDVNTKLMTKMLSESEETEDQYLSYIIRVSGIKKEYQKIWHPSE